MIEYLTILVTGRTAETEERGASAVEYGLLIAGIAALVVAVVFLFGGAISGIFSDTCTAVTAKASTAQTCS